jgi:N-formylglutamate amidohydrolase
MPRYQGRYQMNQLKNPKILVLGAVTLLFFILYISTSNLQSKPLSNIKKIPEDPSLIIAPSTFGYRNFTELIPGHLPLIISIPHGGHLFPYDIPDRRQNIPGIIKSNDINTQEIGHLLSKKIRQRLGGRRPYIIINHMGRSKIDVNRPLKEGVEIGSNNETPIVWNDYHSFIRDTIDEVELRFGRGLLIDIHGM